MIQELAQQLVDLIFDWGYLGIFIMMVIESSFIPFPSEIVLVPAGYLASKGDMSITYIMGSALGGSLLGAFINYYLALTLGRKFLLKFGKYFFIFPETLDKMERYFKSHGHISTFTGRLIPGIRQLISIPAGLARMNIVEFSIFTTLGAGIWALVLTLLGYFIGANEALIHEYLKEITIIVLVLLVILVWIYYTYQKRKA
ncbi:DedA family protein [Sulfurimonas autotrophica]|uniref:SNARE associated Golgi protein-related protein n=1 Tax=Sulfurimonas autotrophica (strain ATCC BAA-671 / DSM 16294 / JCM 11897 / OK10) TaxID=563040 RepID=E0UUK5_SULAO|nr:DedA family protein [Sulfurimonas autotrophica]ADN08441.1 SNARE associated Golgi protein-related protein [Sulfurimonas autotrophica DSM 16294]